MTENGIEMKSDWFITDAPKQLSDVKSQDTIIKYYTKKFASGSMDKNTMFLGQFGSGKTVMAKIIAKSLVCKDLDAGGNPCDKCAACQAINNETYNRDCLYIDAEKMSAQDVRDEVEKFTATRAIRDRNKVIICDEAQALSKEAVEAFLTVTQNPKPGFYFIFTAMSKLQGPKAGALQSRCKVWKMKTPQVDDTYMYLASIAQKKNLIADASVPKEFWTDGLKFIAQNSEYSFRKGIQMLEQCYEGRIFTQKEMEETFGLVSYDDAVAALIQFGNKEITRTTWNIVNGEDYIDKFNLLIKIIGDAQAVKTFGTEFIEEGDKWKWDQAIQLSKTKYFAEMRDVFMELGKQAWLKNGTWRSSLALYLESGTKPTEAPKLEHLQETVPPTTGRRRRVAAE